MRRSRSCTISCVRSKENAMIEWIVTSSVIIGIVLMLRGLLRKKISPGVRYALWLPVLVRLLLPVPVMESSVSVMNFFAQGDIGVREASLQSPDRPDMDTPGRDTQAGREASAPNVVGGGQKPASNKLSGKPDATGRTFPAALTTAYWKAFTAGTGAALMNRVLVWIWLGGTILTALFILGMNLLFRRRLLGNRKLLTWEDGGLKVYQSSLVNVPCLYGLLSPAVYVPSGILPGDSRFKYIVLHEKTHLDHWDHIWSLLRTVCLCVHWFNPLVWLAVRLSRIDAELYCDEGTVRRLEEEDRLGYGEAVISLGVARTSLREKLTCVTSMSTGRRQMKERIRMIVHSPVSKVWAVAVAVLICIGAVCVTFTGGKAQPEDSVTDSAGSSVAGSGGASVNGSGGDLMTDSGGSSAAGSGGAWDDGSGGDLMTDSGGALITGSGEAGAADGGLGKQGAGADHVTGETSRQDNEQTGEQSEPATLFGYNGYTGYLDECTTWTERGSFADCDYDNDGLTDRVYREEVKEWEYCGYRIDFGNGQSYTFPGKWMSGGYPVAQAADLTGDGVNEIIFTQSYGFSSDPMAFGEMAVLKREKNTWREAELPFTRLEDDYSVGLTLHYEQTAERTLRVTCEEGPLDASVELDTELWNDIGYKETYPGQSLGLPVWAVEVEKDGDGPTKLICHVEVFDKNSVDVVVAELVWSGEKFEVADMDYMEPLYQEVSIPFGDSAEGTLTLIGSKSMQDGITYIESIDVSVKEGEEEYYQTIFTEEAALIEWREGEAPRVESLLENGGLVVEDLNFDGYPDIRYQGWIAGDIPYYCWLWDHEKKEYVYAFCIPNVEVDAAHRRLVSRVSKNASGAVSYFYYDGNGNLTPVENP